jgi:hypothetical protein
MRPKDAASCSFASFNIALKERPDDTDSSIELQRTIHLGVSGAEQEQLALGDPGILTDDWQVVRTYADSDDSTICAPG